MMQDFVQTLRPIGRKQSSYLTQHPKLKSTYSCVDLHYAEPGFCVEIAFFLFWGGGLLSWSFRILIWKSLPNCVLPRIHDVLVKVLIRFYYPLNGW